MSEAPRLSLLPITGPSPRPVPRPIRKVLVANRGEIAVRVLRGLRELGIRGAVIYSAADRRGLPVLHADEAYPIGPAPSRESYLRAAAIVELAVANRSIMSLVLARVRPVVGRITGRPWRTALDFNEIPALMRHLGTRSGAL